MRNRTTRYLTGANPKPVQSWNKYNLYHLRHQRLPATHSRTFFQQKWTAKSLARAYHGEQVREAQWERMFSRRLRAVIPMDAVDLGQNDGSRESAGRGAGLDRPNHPAGATQGLSLGVGRKTTVPYMQMTFAPLERRLDVAIFRALFASSARQARQFVVHGAVTVNGQKMRFPGYLLNPGDMFQVDPEMVMFATGAPKTDKQRRGGRQRRLRAKQRREREEQEKEKAESEVAAEDGKKEEKSKPPKGAADALPEEKKPEASKDGENSGDDAAHRKALKELLNRAKAITEAEKNGIRPSRHRADFQEFRRLVRSTLSRSHSGSDQDVSDLEAQFSRLKLLVDKENEIHSKAQEGSSKDSSRDTSKTQNASATSQSSTQPTTPSSQADAAEATALQSALMDPNTPDSRALLAAIPASDLAILKQALYQVHENPIDTSKPYATPWRPKDYMAAFAFIPRYLEVNQNICAAVYVRHPVARPGLAEVPSPYPDAVMALAFGRYLRRR